MPTFDRLSSLMAHFQLSVTLTTPDDANLIVFTGDRRRPRLAVLLPHADRYQHPLAPDAALSARAEWGGRANPLMAALPERVEFDLTRDQSTGDLINVLLAEAQAKRCGAASVLDRLGEILMIRLLRAQIEQGATEPGLLAGLADQRLSRAIVAIHDDPGRNWRNEDLAREAGLSLSRFAELFATRVGETPMAYLRRWRMVLARQDLERGDRVQSVARRYGYGSGETLNRAFRKAYGASPVALRHAS